MESDQHPRKTSRGWSSSPRRSGPSTNHISRSSGILLTYAPFFVFVAPAANVIALVHDAAHHRWIGNCLTTPPAPPVYNPAGPTCFIDDFTVTDSAQ